MSAISRTSEMIARVFSFLARRFSFWQSLQVESRVHGRGLA
jgi:hypothetical protein